MAKSVRSRTPKGNTPKAGASNKAAKSSPKSPGNKKTGKKSTAVKSNSAVRSLYDIVFSLMKVICKTIFSFSVDSTLTKSSVFLMLFLIIHLAGNLAIFAGDEGDKFNAYGYFLRKSPIIIGIEAYLFIALVLHSGAALVIGIRDKKLSAYATTNPFKQSTWNRIRLGVTGVVVGAFILVHLLDFRFGNEYVVDGELKSMKKNPWQPYFGGEKEVKNVRDLYRLQKEIFSDPKRVAFYVSSMVALAYHLKYGFNRLQLKVIPKESRSVGKRWIPLFIDALAVGFAVTVIATFLEQV